MYNHVFVYMQHMHRASRNDIYIYIQKKNKKNKEDLLGLNLSFQG